MTERCERAGRLLRGCRWEGRYDRAKPSKMDQRLARNHWVETGVLTQTASCITYVRDVCRTCGAVREREA